MKKLFLLFYFFLFTTQVHALDLDQAFLNQFDGIAIKTISKSETLHSKSSQHELHGVKEIANILGEDRKIFNAKIIYVNDNDELNDKTTVIWYNSRPERENGEQNSKYAKQLLNLFDTENKENTITKTKEKIKINKKQTDQPIIEQTNSIHSDTSNLKEYDDLKIYKNTNTNKIVIVGKATEIKDGDTIKVSDLFTVRLYGIDTPEKKQLCKNSKGKDYNCGEKAKEYLQKLIGKQNLTCVDNGNGRYGRFLFVCKNSRHNINQEMVKNGWAVSYFNDEYKQEELEAKENKLGIWAGEFERPEVWRKQNK